MGSNLPLLSWNWQPHIEPGLPAELGLWTLDLDSAPADASLLSPDEQARAAAFRFSIHHQRFVSGRSALRLKLSELTGVGPAELNFAYNAWGKPRLSAHSLCFNLAHSGSVALLAIAPFPVGADLEQERDIEFQLLAREVFSPEELRSWIDLSDSEKSRAFYRLWTRKEALLKGMGCGITEHTRQVSVFFENGGSLASSTVSTSGWKIHSFELKAAPHGLTAAVAWLDSGR